MIRIDNIDITNKRVLIRVDFNVPIKNSTILSHFRLEASMPTINYCLERGASVILMSHLGRPKPGNYDKYTMKPVFNYLKTIFNDKIYFSDDCISDKSIELSQNLNPGEIHILENLRYYKEEKLNDVNFAKQLSKHGEVYVNDAFGTSHREHSSNSKILKYFNKKAIGFLMQKEMNYLSNFSEFNVKPTVLVGGAKISSKIDMINHFIGKSNNILIGGGMAFTFLKAQGISIGNSLFEPNMVDIAKKIFIKAEKYNTNIILPKDVVVANDISNRAKTKEVDIYSISNKDIGLDIGTDTIKEFVDVLQKAKLVIWNGPLGAFEYEKFSNGTKLIAEEIKTLTIKGSLKSIIGGGDTASAIMNLKLENYFTHVSTGGGASLELLSGKNIKLKENFKKD